MKNLKNLKLGFKILAGLLVVALIFSIIMPIAGKADYADGEYGYYLQDTNRYLTEEQTDELEKNLQAAANAAKCNVSVLIVDSIDGCNDVWEFAEEIVKPLLDENIGEIALIYYIETQENGDVEKYCAYTYSDAVHKPYNSLTLEITTAFNADILVYDEITALNHFCEKIIRHGEEVYLPLGNSEYRNSSDELQIKGDTYRAALADYDNRLTKTQEEFLLNYMETTARKVKCNVGIVITRDLEGYTDRGYAEAFLDDNFGVTSDSVVLLLLNTYNNPEYYSYQDWISLSGKAESKFQKHVDDIFDETYYALDKNGGSAYVDFDSACLAFCDSVRLYGSFGILRIVLMFVHNPAATLMALIFGIVTSLIVTGAAVSKYKKKKPISAAQYIDRNTINVTFRRDDFIREYTTSVHIDSGGHHGGHHGGHGGGGHHGGGHHGGGGGRHR